MRSLLWSITLCAAPALAGAESLPASIRACAAEPDSLKRLVCYDREVARFPATKPAERKPTTQREPATNPSSGGADAASTASPAGTASPASAASPAGTTTAANTSAAPAPAVAAASSSPAPASTSQQDGNANSSGHVSARVVSIDHVPNEMVLHLDNGQTWQEMQSVPGDLSLQVGDTVKIDKRLGSYWLTGPHVSGMKVRQKS